MEKAIKTPLTDKDIRSLKAGDKLWLSGTIYTARDQAHKKMVEAIKNKEKLPFNLKRQIIYYCGPTPARSKRIIGSAGPTTSSRMDGLTEPLLKKGLKGVIGKGARGSDITKSFKRHKAVYFVAIGGAGALLARTIKSAKIIAYPELGTEAIRELKVSNFPVYVANDIYGRDVFKEGVKKYHEK